MLPPDISEYVARHFASTEHAGVLALLANAKQPGGELADARMLRCALFACTKTLATLQFDLDWLASDSRDVIMSGEFARKDGNWVQVRDLSQPFPPGA